MSGYFLDRLQGLTTLKLLGREQAELAAIAQTSDTFREKTMRVLRIAFLSSAVLEFFSAVAVALVAVYVGLSLLGLLHFPADSKIDLQTALFALLLAPEFFAPLKQLAVYYHDRAQALAAADALLHIFEQPIAESPSAKSQPSTYCLELQSVDKAYQQRPILVGIDWQIRAGETWLITGDSGAGKTTLLSLLLGFDAADSGEIRLNGERLNRENAAQTIAWMGQQSTLFYGTIADNIRLFDEAISDEEIIAAAQIAAVANFSDTLPDGLQTLIGENGYGLSGGQIQRIALARALLKNAPIIILDEPTAHLDAQIKTVVLDNVLLWGAGKTLIIASHDPELIERIPRRIHIQNGRLKCAI
jgi:ATP-binding cassette subfamily C protein CydD